MHKISYKLDVPDFPNIDSSDICALVNLATPGPNYITQAAPIHSDLNFEAWEKYSHIFSPSDPSLLQQLKWGFPTGVDQPENLSVPFTNHLSARKNPQIVEQYIQKHLPSKALYGPFDANPLDKPVTVSPLQVAFSSSGKSRVCNDLSYGQCSVNSLISSQWNDFPGYFGDLELPRIDCLVRAIIDKGPTCLLWKTDYSAFYKQLSIDPGDLPQLAFAFSGKLYFEARLPFGLRSSCLNAQRVTNAVLKIYSTMSPAFVAGYIDDVVGCSHATNAVVEYSSFRGLNKELGLATTEPKCVSPCPALVWIGLECDAAAMKLRLPQDKLLRIIEFLSKWLEQTRASKSDIQAILGVLNHAAAAIIVGRAFTGHILDLLKEKEFPITLPEAFYRDVQFWLHLLQTDISDGFSMKTPTLIPIDHLVQIAIDSDMFAVRVLDVTQIFQVQESDIDIDHKCLYILAFCKATQLAASRFPRTWITCGVMTENAVRTINRAHNVCDELRPIVRATWAIQAAHDMVIRARKVICERPIDRVLRSADSGNKISRHDIMDNIHLFM